MWYFIEDNQKRGSFSLEEMESLANQGDINENTLVWKKGMKEWQPLSQTELNDILPENAPPPIPGESPPPFPTTYRNIQKERVEETIPHQSDISRDSRIKLLYAAKARIWAHWLFWLLIPYVGGIISVTKTKSWETPPLQEVSLSWSAVAVCIFPILMAVLPQIFANWYVYLLYFVNMLMGAYTTQQIIEKARNQLNIKDPLQAEKQLLNHF
ncbi:MAG: DUF4339 domain-containing protein [Dolichospermum sp.]